MNVTPNLAFATARIGRVGALIVISVGLLALAAAAQTTKDVKGTTPLVAVPNEPPAKLIVDPPIPEQLAQGRVFIQACATCSAECGSWSISQAARPTGDSARL
jgi:hypothetical protein